MARPVRHRQPTPFSVALEPFIMARSVVHAAAAPLVHNTPRILAAAAEAPTEESASPKRRGKQAPAVAE